MSVKRLVVGGGVTASAVLFGTMFHYRPFPSTHPEFEHNHEKMVNGGMLLRAARTAMLTIAGEGCRFMLGGMNNLKIHHGERLTDLIDDRGDRGLLTVCNHASSIDDPFVLACLVPHTTLWSQQQMRWSVCSEEFCHANDFVASLTSAGKAFPIRRGGGIWQDVVGHLSDKLVGGHWVHFFPEGRVWQEEQNAPRDENGCRMSSSGRPGPKNVLLGPLKWGVGRMICEAAERREDWQAPHVVPFFHVGVEDVMPVTYKCHNANKLPRPGKSVHIVIGESIDFTSQMSALRTELEDVRSGRRNGKKGETYVSMEDEELYVRRRHYKQVTDLVTKAMVELDRETRDICTKVEPADGMIMKRFEMAMTSHGDANPNP